METRGELLDRKEKEAIENARQRETLRQERIFNARERLIGVDKPALDRQTAEKTERLKAEDERNAAYGRESNKNAKLGLLYAQRQERDQHDLSKRINEFRFKHQTNESRREWDLNDPDSKKNSTPVRVADVDANLGISSAQVYDGEDLAGPSRNAIQQQQRRQWADCQKEEKLRREQEEAYTTHKYLTEQIAWAEQWQNMLDQKEAKKAAELRELKEFNLKQAREKREREAAEKNRELQDKLTDIRNNVTGTLLTEDPAVAKSTFGSHRVLTDRWKGMSPAQVEEIRKTQELQRRENKLIQNQNKEIDNQWDNDRIQQAKTLMLMERSEKRQRRDIQKCLDGENQSIAKEQNERLNHMDSEVYTNRPTSSYFDQFNTTSR
jgi:hypothetical protein